MPEPVGLHTDHRGPPEFSPIGRKSQPLVQFPVMSVIKAPLLFVGCQGEKHFSALYDSGAILSRINPEHLPDLELPISLG